MSTKAEDFHLLLPALPVYALRLGIRQAGVGLVIGVCDPSPDDRGDGGPLC